MIKILLIEDDEYQVLLYKTFLEMRDCSLRAVASEADARAALAAEKPDIVVSDIILGAESGLDIIEHLRQDGSLGAIPFLFFTNTNKEEYRERARAMGAGFLIKAETLPQALLHHIKSVLDIPL